MLASITECVKIGRSHALHRCTFNRYKMHTRIVSFTIVCATVLLIFVTNFSLLSPVVQSQEDEEDGDDDDGSSSPSGTEVNTKYLTLSGDKVR